MLEGKNLRYVYKSGFFHKSVNVAVDDVSIRIEDGKSSSIVGESGSGKTTLLKMLTLQLMPKSGEIIYNGRVVNSEKNNSQRKDFLRRVQLIPQNPYDAVDPRWTVAKSVAEPLKIHGFKDADESVDMLFKEVGLSSELKDRYPHELSGGELQRVVIARTLSLKPEVLVCDEITSMLDVSVQAYIMSILKSIQKNRGVSMFFVTHDLALARASSEYIYVMHKGRVVEEGRDVLINPTDDYTKRLVSAMRYEKEHKEFIS
ncbi:MAG TPA: dipeptide/oligopeptide/nickel ABC transporter ATP-binding protein [Methanocorpusculum sp.]|nr:dipeptide/oligopeptide/nickel ABC transporter ATP-binding protein [Methanocorpusculum sp.]